MKNGKLNLLILISSEETSRIYLVLLKRYLQKKLPEATINYFISQHDVTNSTVKKSVYAESEKLNKDVDVLLGLDGYLPEDLLKCVKGEKYLLNLPETGMTSNVESYTVGYDYLVVFEKDLLHFYQKKCNEKGIKVLDGNEDPFYKELNDNENRILAKRKLLKRYPQIEGKRVLSIVTRGKCDKRYINKYKKLNMKKLLKQLPDDVVLMSNCPQIELAASALPQKYCDKFIVFGQRELVEVLMISNWNYSNMGVLEKMACKSKMIVYSNNKLEKNKGKECIKLWDCKESILEEFYIKTNIDGR